MKMIEKFQSDEHLKDNKLHNALSSHIWTIQQKATRSMLKITAQPTRGESCALYLVSSTPSLILHLQAELKSGAGTQQSSSPDSCTSSS